MADRPKVLVFAGSARKASVNRKLARLAAAAVDAAGGAATLVELGELALPLYDGDDEAASGLPEGAKRLKAAFLSHRGLLLACPEYNSSVTPLLKNAIDWVSRPAPGEASLAAFEGKVAALCSASPGGYGGLRGLVTVRSILGNIRVTVLPDQLAIAKAYEAFDDAGALRDATQKASLDRLAAALVRACAAFDAAPRSGS
jgi:chromate reductase, NAD(P)H dehydrogenase (quinone)